MNNPKETNRKHWDEIASVHYHSYDIQTLRGGGSLIDDLERKELGEIKDKTLLHLQCHIGTDSISLEREGAIVTAADFSGESITIANTLKSEFYPLRYFILQGFGRHDRR